MASSEEQRTAIAEEHEDLRNLGGQFTAMGSMAGRDFVIASTPAKTWCWTRRGSSRPRPMAA
jgi:hypothetical protein